MFHSPLFRSLLPEAAFRFREQHFASGSHASLPLSIFAPDFLENDGGTGKDRCAPFCPRSFAPSFLIWHRFLFPKCVPEVCCFVRFSGSVVLSIFDEFMEF